MPWNIGVQNIAHIAASIIENDFLHMPVGTNPEELIKQGARVAISIALSQYTPITEVKVLASGSGTTLSVNVQPMNGTVTVTPQP